MKIAVLVLLILSSAYSLAAVVAFTLVFAPFAAEHRLLAFMFTLLVLAPHALLLEANRRAPTRKTTIATAVCAAVACAIGAYWYHDAFGFNDGEYALAFVLGPMAQAPFAIFALVVSSSRASPAE